MDKFNPYEAPASSLMTPFSRDSTALASRWARLGAAFIDGLIFLLTIWAVEKFFNFSISTSTTPEPTNVSEILATFDMFSWNGLTQVLYGFGFYIVLNAYFLKQNGQTIGKKLLSIKIVDMNHHKPSLATLLFLRDLPVQSIVLVPFIGVFLSIIDILFIFGEQKRCLHDLIAKTQVVIA